MGVGYIRQDVANNIAAGKPASAADLDGEFDGIVAAFALGTGHTHDGTTGEGGPIGLTGPAQDYLHTANAILPKTTDAYDLGSSTFEWKDLWVAGTADIFDLVVLTATIEGGAIDGTIIGGTTPAAITGTTITGANFVGPVTGTVTGSLVGNASTATTLQTARIISLTGEIVGSASFNGSADAVISAVIPNASIATVKLADLSVTSAKIANSNVTTVKIADNAVTTAKILNSAVTTGKIADNSVTTNKVADGSITTEKLVDGSVTSAKLADNSVSNPKISDASITTTKIQDNSVTNVKINDGAITFEKLSAGMVITESETIASNDTDTVVPTSAAVKDYVDSTVVGVGQTWQNVISFREGGTSYQNTTNKPIMVNITSISTSGSTARSIQVSADDLNWVTVGRSEVNESVRRSTVSFMVPVGHYYRVTGAIEAQVWAELRE